MWQNQISVEAEVARNLGDEDWEDLAQDIGNEGCSVRPRMEMERSKVEPEPVIDKFFDEKKRVLSFAKPRHKHHH